MGTAQRSLPVNPSSLYGQGMMQPRPGVGNAGKLNNLSYKFLMVCICFHLIVSEESSGSWLTSKMDGIKVLQFLKMTHKNSKPH